MNQFYNNVKTALLLGLMTVLIVGIGSFFGSNGIMIALVMAAVMNVAGYFFSDKIAIASMRGQEVGPEHPLYQIVDRLIHALACRCQEFMFRQWKRPTRSRPVAIRATPPCVPRRVCLIFWIATRSRE